MRMQEEKKRVLLLVAAVAMVLVIVVGLGRVEFHNELERDRGLLKQLSANCSQRQIELSWEEKAKTMMKWYEKLNEK